MGYDPRQRRADVAHEQVSGHCRIHGIRRCTICLISPPVHETVDQAAIDAGRIAHIRDMCETAIEHDRGASGSQTTRGLTDRQWLAQSVLNVLNGNIDAQIKADDPSLIDQAINRLRDRVPGMTLELARDTVNKNGWWTIV